MSRQEEWYRRGLRLCLFERRQGRFYFEKGAGCEDIELLSEALYHINCDYDLSCYLQWSMLSTARDNPFRGYFDLWKPGLRIHFPARDRIVLVD